MTKSYTIGCSHMQTVNLEQNLPLHFLLHKEAHVWITEVASWDAQFIKLENLLSIEEVAKANRFVFKKDRDLYLVAHGILRMVLHLYTGVTPEKMIFDTSSHGKPYLVSSTKDCYFNLSHAGQMIAVSINAVDETGIDIEKMVAGFTWEGIAENYFSERELMNLKSLNYNESVKTFYTYWTRKEAFLKAIGLGLTDDISSIEIASSSNKINLKGNQNVITKSQNWHITSFGCGDNYLSSVAFSPAISQIHFFDANLLLKQQM